MRGFYLLSTLLLVPAAVLAADLHVPGQYPTIQAAIDAAVDGDTVIVAPGLYKENVYFKKKAVTVESTGGPYVTIIDGNKTGRPVSFDQGEGLTSILDGFGLTNGESSEGGAVFCKDASPTIMNNYIYENHTPGFGGGIHLKGSSSPLIFNNVFRLNTALAAGCVWCGDSSSPVILQNAMYENAPDHQGGGVFCGGASSPLVSGNYIHDNPAGWGGGGIHVGDASTPTIEHNVIYGNSSADGGGISLENDSYSIVKNNLIYDNLPAWNGGGIFCGGNSGSMILNNTITANGAFDGGGIYCVPTATATVTDCIVYENYAVQPTGPEIFGTLTVTYCDVKGGYMGTGNIDADPLFMDPFARDFHLQQDPPQPGVNNPCVDAGSDLAINLNMDQLWTRTDQGPDAGVVDMGYHYGPEPDFWWKRLTVYPDTIPESTGGTADFTLNAGAANAGRTYLMVGSISGTAPGIPLPGGKTALPLNWDVFTGLVLDLLNTSIFHNFYATLDSEGKGSASFTVVWAPGSAGLKMYYAYTLMKPYDFVSNPVTVTMVP